MDIKPGQALHGRLGSLVVNVRVEPHDVPVDVTYPLPDDRLGRVLQQCI
jgi:hypothetical protein